MQLIAAVGDFTSPDEACASSNEKITMHPTTGCRGAHRAWRPRARRLDPEWVDQESECQQGPFAEWPGRGPADAPRSAIDRVMASAVFPGWSGNDADAGGLSFWDRRRNHALARPSALARALGNGSSPVPKRSPFGYFRLARTNAAPIAYPADSIALIWPPFSSCTAPAFDGAAT